MWFSDIDRIAKVRCSSLLSIILSILNPSGPSSISYISPRVASRVVSFVMSGITLYALFCVIFYSGTNPRIITAGVNPWRRTSLPFTEGKILGMLRLQIVFAPGSRSNTYFLTWLMTNWTFLSTKPAEKEWLIGARIWVVPWDSKKAVISAPVKWEPLSWKMQRGNPKTGTRKLS